MMRRILLTAAVMFGAAGLGVLWVHPNAQAAPATTAAQADPLGDLSALETIAADTATLARTGDLAKAKARITDFESAWDDAEATMRPKDPTAWGNVDAAADDAIHALRAGTPDPAKVEATLAALSATLAHPGGGAGGAAPVAGAIGPDGKAIATDANGRPLPCEEMAGALRAALAAATNLAAADEASAADLQAKGLERCNADDDARADAFFAQGIELLAQGA